MYAAASLPSMMKIAFSTGASSFMPSFAASIPFTGSIFSEFRSSKMFCAFRTKNETPRLWIAVLRAHDFYQ
jgi:hypothetical protein